MTGDFDLTGIDWEPIGNMNDMENPPPLGGDSLRLWIKLCKIINLIIRKGVKERREQQVAEKNESREAVPRAGVEANTAVKDEGKAERKAVTQKKAMPGKETVDS